MTHGKRSSNPAKPLQQGFFILLLRWTCLACCLCLGNSAQAEVIQQFSPQMKVADGQDGRIFRNWIQPVKNTPIQKVQAVVVHQDGGADCYVNLRFGSEGSTLDGGKRVAIKPGKQTITWNLAGQAANGRPLVMKAYKGTVFIRQVTTHR